MSVHCNPDPIQPLVHVGITLQLLGVLGASSKLRMTFWPPLGPLWELPQRPFMRPQRSSWISLDLFGVTRRRSVTLWCKLLVFWAGEKATPLAPLERPLETSWVPLVSARDHLGFL